MKPSKTTMSGGKRLRMDKPRRTIGYGPGMGMASASRVWRYFPDISRWEAEQMDIDDRQQEPLPELKDRYQELPSAPLTFMFRVKYRVGYGAARNAAERFMDRRAVGYTVKELLLFRFGHEG